MADAQKVSAQTAAVLKSTGGVANVTAKHADALANSLLNVSGTDDEVIKSGENMLLTFTNIRNEVGKGSDIFDRATKTALDMSTALGQDMKQSALQLGKALNDPIKGVGALRRVGVAFTDQQKDQIKQLVKTGHTLDAQKVILRELSKEFGGSAKAAGDTLSGKLNKLRNTALNLGAQLAETLLPSITKIVDAASKWLSSSENQKTIMDTLRTAVGLTTKALNVLKGAFEVLAKVVGGNRNAIILLVSAYATFKVAQITSSVVNLAKSFGVLSRKQAGAAGSTRALRGSLLGKAGLVAGVGVASFEIATMILKLTGLDKKLRSAGGSAFDFAAKIGLVHDPMAQFKGTRIVGQGGTKFLINQARLLERSGKSSAQAAAAIVRSHPNVALHDARIWANMAAAQIARGGGGGGGGRRMQLVAAGGTGTNIHIEHFHSSAPNVRQMEDELMRRSRARPHPRRGP